MSIKNCFCGKELIYTRCCGRIHKGTSQAETAEDLMRSRYAAFTLADGDYLQKSHHSATKPTKKENKDIVHWARTVHWVKLEVLESTKGLKNDSEGTVEFKAYFIENGKLDIIHEKSYFEKEINLWKYVKAF